MPVITPSDSRLHDRYPTSVIYASEIIVVLCLVMFVVEIALEILWVAEAIPAIAFRLEFLFLTGLSALLSVHSLLGIRRHKLDVTSSSLQISALVEIALIISDVVPLFELKGHDLEMFFYYRVGFILLTGINCFCIVWIAVRLHLAQVFTLFCTSDRLDEEAEKEAAFASMSRAAVDAERQKVLAELSMSGSDTTTTATASEGDSTSVSLSLTTSSYSLVSDSEA